MGSEDSETDGGFDMADSGSDFSEFNLDLDTKIPKLKFGETTHDFISYSSNGLEHLISFSIPLAGWKQGKGWKGPGQMIKGNATEFANCLNIYFGPAGLMFSDDSYSDAVEKGKYTSKGFNAVIIFTGRSCSNTTPFTTSSGSSSSRSARWASSSSRTPTASPCARCSTSPSRSAFH